MRYDTEHKQRTRERVLRAAARAIRGDGPQRVGVAGVMREAGLTHGGFYAHFASKDELVAAAIAQMFDDALAYWQRVAQDRSDAAALRAYVEGYLSMAHRDAPERGCPIAALASDLPRLDAAARQAFSDGTQRLSDVLARPLQRLGHDDADALARSLLAELVGALALARCEADPGRAAVHLDASRRQALARLNLENTR
jgi:TetR/AcrR family transcriptional repressor of nem operon